jgi:hypothetical protein
MASRTHDEKKLDEWGEMLALNYRIQKGKTTPEDDAVILGTKQPVRGEKPKVVKTSLPTLRF